MNIPAQIAPQTGVCTVGRPEVCQQMADQTKAGVLRSYPQRLPCHFGGEGLCCKKTFPKCESCWGFVKCSMALHDAFKSYRQPAAALPSFTNFHISESEGVMQYIDARSRGLHPPTRRLPVTSAPNPKVINKTSFSVIGERTKSYSSSRNSE